MDLTKLMNQSDDNDRKEPTAAQQHPSQQRPPSHHSQSPAPYGYRDYPPGPQTQQSPVRQGREQLHHGSLPQHQQQHAGAYEQPSPYQTPGTYQHPHRAGAPPALQQTNSYHHDARSPSTAMPAPSPASYRHPQTPSASSGAAPGYPFPHTQNAQEMTSPGARQHYPPQAQYSQQRHDGFAQGVPASGPSPYAQQQGSVPQTPPVATSLPPSLSHQRSQSVQSSPTPTSANSQQPYGPPYHGSPMSGTQPHPGPGYPRQPSQPPTPGGAQSISHSAGARPLVGPTDSYKQTPSPYQQRNQLPSAQASPHLSSAHPPLQRHSTSRSNLNSPVAEAHPRPPYLRERQRSISISPKTKVTPLPNHVELQHPSQEIDRKPLYPQHMAIDGEMSVTPAKRKMEDRDVSPQSMERKHPRPMSTEVNGQHAQVHHAARIKSESPVVPRKTRKRRETVPRWAQSKEILNGNPPKHEGFVLRPRVHVKSNGFVSRQASPEASRTQQQPQPQNNAPPTSAAAAAQPTEPKTEDYLGPWEPSITGRKPFEEASKVVADEFFNNIIRLPDLREIQSLGIQFEIEAKLGQLIDRRTNHRVDRGLRSEAVLWEGEQNFRSSMSEETHKGFNDFLNACVVEAHPRKTGGSRVQIDYKHRREVDRFFDLTPEMLNQLPACVRSRFGQGKRPRVRVTHDQQKGVLLGKIVKARVCDIDLHMPNSAMDCRISINLEMNWDGSLEELEAANPPDARQPDRNKDRLSYSHGLYQIDLTQVTQGQIQGKAPKKEHELEIELSADMVLTQGRRVLQGEAHRYGELVDGFLDNVRLLARKANEYQR